MRAVTAFAARNKIPARSLSLQDATTDPAVLQAGLDPTLPSVVFGQDEVLTPQTPQTPQTGADWRRLSPGGWALIWISTGMRFLTC